MEAIQQKLRAIYSELPAFFDKIERRNDYGYKIFNSPPKLNAPVMFIGYQPGGGAVDWEYEKSRNSHREWPQESEYAVADWLLAKRLRKIFDGHVDLNETVGLNAIFLRSPSIADYERDLSRNARYQVKEFSNRKVCEIVELLKSKRIITIGFAALKMFGKTKTDLIGARGRALTQLGSINGREALASMHLTGAHISSEDLERLSRRLVDYAKEK